MMSIGIEMGCSMVFVDGRVVGCVERCWKKAIGKIGIAPIGSYKTEEERIK